MVAAAGFAIFLILWYPLAWGQLAGPSSGFVPKAGFVPTADVARIVAEAVLLPVYGEKTITAERPFKATLKGDIWTVTGSVPCNDPPRGAVCPGGAAQVRISKKTGQILYMTHDQ
jgi:hypothetical protein